MITINITANTNKWIAPLKMVVHKMITWLTNVNPLNIRITPKSAALKKKIKYNINVYINNIISCNKNVYINDMNYLKMYILYKLFFSNKE